MSKYYACEIRFLREYLSKLYSATPEQISAAQALSGPARSISDIQNGIAKINIRGLLVDEIPAIMRYFGYQSTSYREIQQAVAEAAASDVKRVELLIDSPGGYVVSALDETWKAIRELSQTKDVIAINQDMTASAAYWIASAAPRIISASDLTQQGSIGVYASFFDYTEYDKKLGIREVIVVSKNAPLKHLTTDDERLVDQIRERLDNIERVFLSRVAEGRNKKTDYIAENFGQGALLNNKKALSVGMIDEAPNQKKISTAGTNASAENSTKKPEKSQMPSLKELLAENPGANAEVEALKRSAFDEGFDKGQKSVREQVAAATPFLTNINYSDHIHNLAARVIAGEATKETLLEVVGIEDKRIAEAAAKKTQEESNAIPPTPATPPNASTYQVDGVIRNEEDLAAEIERLKRR